MSSKKKLIVSLSAVAAVVLVAVISIVAVLAATAQEVRSAITIRYVAGLSISGSATANYYVGNTTAPNAMVDEDGKSTIYFFANDKDNNGQNLAPAAAISLEDAQYAYVIFEYTFTNNGDSAYNAALTVEKDDSDSGKYQLYYTTAMTKGDDGKDTTTWTTASDTTVMSIDVAAKNGATDGSSKFFVKVELPVADRGASYNFVADFVWALTAQGE